MAHSWIHAKLSAKRFGGTPADYLPIHDWLDGTKELEPTFRHRALRHHTHGIFEAERVFGHIIINSNGREVPVRVIAEQHIKEDFGGFIPTPHDWLKSIQEESWMQPSAAFSRKINDFANS
jgi:hypothetical protein